MQKRVPRSQLREGKKQQRHDFREIHSDEEEEAGTGADDSAPTQSDEVEADERVPTQAHEAVETPDAAAELEAVHAAAISTDLIEGGTGEDLLLVATQCEDADAVPMEAADVSASRETSQAFKRRAGNQGGRITR